MRKRKSILFYFDNYWLVSQLPDEQLGILFRLLMEYGELEANGQDGTAALERYYPRMTERTQMAFAFMADTLRRDAEAYTEKSANYRAAAQRRWGTPQEPERPAEQQASPPPERRSPRPASPERQANPPRRSSWQSPTGETREEEMARYVRRYREKYGAAHDETAP